MSERADGIGLKVCPFCGNDAAIETFKTAMEKMARYRVRCCGCWCKTDWENWSIEEAAEKWNRRADSDGNG